MQRHEDELNALFDDARRRLRATMEDAARVVHAMDRRPHAWGWALVAGEYNGCSACGAWGMALEVHGQICEHPRHCHETRSCWFVVTPSGNATMLTRQMVDDLRANEEREGIALRAAGIVPASLDVPPTQTGDTPISELIEYLELAPSHRTAHSAVSCRRSYIWAQYAREAYIYTTARRPPSWPR